MKVLSALKRFICYILVVLPIACLQQEVQPKPDQNTRACLLKSNTAYVISGDQWATASWQLYYNKDGNPSKWTFSFNGLTIYKTYTLEYDDKLKLKQMNHYKGGVVSPDNLFEKKTYTISANLDTLIEHSFRVNANKLFDEVLTRQFVFFRNGNSDLRLRKVETLNTGTREKIGPYGVYKLFEYDQENRNVNKIFKRNNSIVADSLFLSYDGFDPNSRSPWNANFWLSFIQGDADSFIGSTGFWSENNLSIAKQGETKPFNYYVYELNDQGFTCVSSAKQADKVVNPEETFWYYYNCDCRKR